jgi:hypothetical protein
MKKYKLTFKKKTSIFWNDLTDLDGYTKMNECVYRPLHDSGWKRKPDVLIVEIIKNNEKTIIKDFEKWAEVKKLEDCCNIEEIP